MLRYFDQVEIAKNFGDESKPRAWSKYSRDSSAYKKMMEKLEEKKKKDRHQMSSGKKSSKKISREEQMNKLLGDVRQLFSPCRQEKLLVLLTAENSLLRKLVRSPLFIAAQRRPAVRRIHRSSQKWCHEAAVE